MKNQKKDAISLLIADHDKVKSLFKEFESLGDRAVVSKKKIAEQICTELTIHAEVEEQIFYPAIRIPLKNDDLLDEAVVEHASAKDLIEQIQSMNPDDELYDAKVKVLSEQIEHHIEEEEGDMFPEVRKGKIDLVELGEKMESFKNDLVSPAMSARK